MPYNAGNGIIAIRADEAHGGAISSLVVNGFQYLNASDNGRLLQTAVQWDNKGEQDNPTEGGSAYDTHGVSSSQIIWEYGQGTIISAYSRMANWFPVAGNLLSNTYLGKTYEVGWRGLPNVIHARIVVLPGESHQIIGGIEVATAYIPETMWVMRSYNPGSEAWYSDVNQDPDTYYWTNNQRSDAIVAATPDGMHAMGLWGPRMAMFGDPRYIPTDHVMKIDAYAWAAAPQAGVPIVFNDLIIAVGDIWQVKDTLFKAHALVEASHVG